MSQLVHVLTTKNEGVNFSSHKPHSLNQGSIATTSMQKISLPFTKKILQVPIFFYFTNDQIIPVESGLSKPNDAVVEPLGPPSSKNIKSQKEKNYPKNPAYQGFTETFEQYYQRKKVISSSKSAEKSILSPKLDTKARC
jgi:hypothetical protein